MTKQKITFKIKSSKVDIKILPSVWFFPACKNTM